MVSKVANKQLTKRALTNLVYKLYTEPSSGLAFGSPYKIYKYLKTQKYKITLEQVTKELEKIKVYQTHRQARQRFQRIPIFTKGIDYIHEADLIDLSSLAKYNDNHKFLLNVIDTFSKVVSLRAIKNKSNDQVVSAFKSIYRVRKSPVKLHTDRGTEFYGSVTSKYLRDKNIILYSNYSSQKASIVERSNKSVLSVLWKMLDLHNTFRYLEFLPQIEYIINNRFHRTIKCFPSQVNKKNEKEIWNRIYSKYLNKENKEKPLCVNDKVRISKYMSVFSKKYKSNFTSEVFTIAKVKHPEKGKTVYFLKDKNNEPILGLFYRNDLSFVNSNEK